MQLRLSASGRNAQQRDRTQFHNVGTKMFPPFKESNIRCIKVKSQFGNNVIILILCQQTENISLAKF